ncbi:MAG: hypothetical protein HUJ74_01990 [Lachnospiraceae bacterium]|nr:hypothetical protein [Lachnospiraceae bacterium]
MFFLAVRYVVVFAFTFVVTLILISIAFDSRSLRAGTINSYLSAT